MGAVSDFFAMGGYAVYVWGAFGVTAIVLVGLLLSTLRASRERERKLEYMTQRQDRHSEDPS